MSILIQPSAAAGFASLMGQIKATGNSLVIPEGQLNIGGNGKGFLIDPVASFNPASASNRDDSFAALTLGDDIYIYACATSTGFAKLVCSKNATYPTGYTALNSRKIGGFHYGRVRPIANRFDAAYAPLTTIVPNSVWDLQHRPKSDPTGMVEVIPGALWVDIYLNSTGAGAWPETVPVSKFGIMPLKDDIYARSDFQTLARNAGKRMPRLEEFIVYAEGCPQGSDANNDTAWSKTTNTGPAATGTVAKALSQYNVVDCAGNLWEYLDNHYDQYREGYTHKSNSVLFATGQDSSRSRGQMYTSMNSAESHSGWSTWAAGGNFSDGSRCGSRALYSSTPPWRSYGDGGLRCVSDSL